MYCIYLLYYCCFLDAQYYCLYFSTGGGRTGTFLTLWYLQFYADQKRPNIRVNQTVREIMENRDFLIETKVKTKTVTGNTF